MMAYQIPTIVHIWGDCESVGDLSGSGAGTTRYCVTCDALKDGQQVKIQHPWRALTSEEAIGFVRAHHAGAYDDIKNCKAVEIPGSYRP